MSEKIFTTDTFDTEVKSSPVPVLVDFNAVWCGPCRMIAPFISEIAEEYEGRLTVGKVDVDENPELAAAHGIEYIPTLVLKRAGKPADKLTGYHTKAEIIAWIEKCL